VKQIILVIGATGAIGTQTVRHLLKLGATVRAAVRSKEKIGDLDPQLVEVVEANTENRGSLLRACSGVQRLFLLPPMIPEMAQFCQAWTEPAIQEGVQHIVKLSGLGTETEAIDLFRWHRAGERIVESSGVPWTFLRPNSFHQNFVAFNSQSIREQNQFYLPLADAAWSTVDTSDVGSVAARTLTRDDLLNQSIEITGPDTLTNIQIANLFSEILGKSIRYVPVSDEIALAGMLGGGMPDWAANAVLDLYRFIRKGSSAQVSGAVPRITTNAAISFREFVEKNKAAFVQT
jgi:uncharacterized protein YbjT (DUF2867 family)